MKTTRLHLASLLTAGTLVLTSFVSAESPDRDVTGKLDYTLNARLETVSQTGRGDARALTLGSDLGYAISFYDKVKFYAQLENTAALDGDAYNQAGLNPDGADRAVVADPEITELNQLWVAAKYDAIDAKLGRQIIIYDNARFVGNVGWRQNMQTFDAARVTIAAPDTGIAFDYAYLDRVLRVLGRDHPAGEWESESHLVHIQWKARPNLTVTGYNYLLDFDDARANSCATTGLALTGKHPIGDETTTLQYRLEFARQTDHASSPFDYEADYWCLEGGITRNGWTLLGGYEDLGSDNGVGFRTPLATLHAFNGWADQFLGTPGSGLTDLYVKVATTVEKFKIAALYHDFSSSSGSISYGNELNISAARKLTDDINLLAKFASFDGTNGRPNVTKFWLQTVFKF